MLTMAPAESATFSGERLVDVTVAGALALQSADIYGSMGVRPVELEPPVKYCGHDMHVAVERQPSGAFKYRGASAAVLGAKQDGYESVVTVSTGSHGVSIGMAAARVGMSAEVHTPDSITSTKYARLRSTGANVIMGGQFSDAKARAESSAEGVFIHPFADQKVRNGQATLGLELVAHLEQQGLTGFDGDIIIPVAVAGGSHILGIAGPVAAAKQSGRLGHGVKVVAIRPKGKAVDALAIREEDRDPANQSVLEDSRFVAQTHTVSDRQIGEALLFLQARGLQDVEAAGALPTAFALAYARRYPYSQGNSSQRVSFVLPVSGLNGCPESNAPFLNTASAPRVPAAAGRLAVAKPAANGTNGAYGRLGRNRVGHSPVRG